MVFNSLTFAIFFVVVYGLYLLSMRRLAWQNFMLLVASNVFYGWWDYRFLGLIWFSMVVDYLAARLIDRRGYDEGTFHYSASARKWLLAGSVTSNLLILGFFKYYGFFVTSLVEAADAAGIPLHPPVLHVILPVGISFYTFQSLSYTIDVYRGELRACRSLADFALFVSFFPQLVAGPIVRAVDFLPQVQRQRRLNLDQIYEGAWLILWGLFKKVVLADNLSRLVEPVFRETAVSADGQLVLIAVYAFAVQIYCDFSGYTDIARGCAKLMGFEFNLNFDLPYLACNPRDFWRRWHISLSSWLRDYLYIPLGGNRRGSVRTCVNLMVTMLLGGLWHGASWTYVLWGGYHGALLVIHRQCEPVLARAGRWMPSWTKDLRKALTIIVFFHVTCLGWLIFRANSVAQIGSLLSSLLTPWPWWLLTGANTIHAAEAGLLIAYVLPLLVVQLVQYAKDDLNVVLRLPAPARGLLYLAAFYGLVWYGVDDARPFIYFQF
jgi:D-alanyl-lipoteichoic acid acyltransferase DltB (MBOAT superfamily)